MLAVFFSFLVNTFPYITPNPTSLLVLSLSCKNERVLLLWKLIPKRSLYVQHTCIKRLFLLLQVGWETLFGEFYKAMQVDVVKFFGPFIVSSVEIGRKYRK